MDNKLRHLPLGVGPPPLNFFSFAIELYIYETDFTLGPNQKYHFRVLL